MFNLFNKKNKILKNLDRLIKEAHILQEKMKNEEEYDNLSREKIKNRVDALKKLSTSNTELSEYELHQIGLLKTTSDEKNLIEKLLKKRGQKMLSEEEMEIISKKRLLPLMEKKTVPINEEEYEKFIKESSSRQNNYN